MNGLRFAQFGVIFTIASLILGHGAPARSAPAIWTIPPAPQPGVNTVALADVEVARPDTQPCIVDLLTRHDFQGADPVRFTYAPPAACPGPWARVVIEAAFDIDPGRQFDRSAAIHLGGVNFYYGSTMEPRRTIGPSWRVARDVTDYEALLRSPQDGDVLLGNVVNETYTSHVHASARLLFYPLKAGAQATNTAQLVLPISDGARKLNQAEPGLEKAVQLPTNVERMVLDVIAQGQADDEFWYGCVPDRLASAPDDRCGGGPFREVEVLIDDQPAGFAPVSPWIFTGGVNPYLWFPTPAPETLNFKPFRIDLTPFAGLVDDGRVHRVAVRVLGVRNYFLVTASLLVWRDPGASTVTGALTSDTLAAPILTVDDAKASASGRVINGGVKVKAARDGLVSGFVNTSRGKITTRLSYQMRFKNTQTYATAGINLASTVSQVTHWSEVAETVGPAGTARRETRFSYPLSLNSKIADLKDSQPQSDIADVAIIQHVADTAPNHLAWTYDLENHVVGSASGQFDRVNRKIVSDKAASQQTYRLNDSRTGCYARTIRTANNVVISVQDGCAAPNP
jgi:hypothetical protein